MRLKEGEVYEGPVEAFGGADSVHTWIVVSPSGRVRAHSLDDPLDHHWMPVEVAALAIEEGRMRCVDVAPKHPVVRLQCIKEKWGIYDSHLGLYGENAERMIQLFKEAVASGEDYASYAGGEIVALLSTRYPPEFNEAVKKEIFDLLARMSVNLVPAGVLKQVGAVKAGVTGAQNKY